MKSFLLLLTAFFTSNFKERRDLALENLALRRQLAVLKREGGRPVIKKRDRLFWVWLSRIWKGWRESLIIIKPETVIGWHRQGFRLCWTKLSRRKTGGRPSVDPKVKALIKQMGKANPLWGAPRIHGELLKLGIEISERTVSRLMPEQRKPPTQTWRTFLDNHLKELVSIDLFTVPTILARISHWRGTRHSHERSKRRRRERSSQSLKSAGCIIVTDEPHDVGDPFSSVVISIKSMEGLPARAEIDVRCCRATRRRREIESSIRRRDQRRIIGEWALHRQDGFFGTDRCAS